MHEVDLIKEVKELKNQLAFSKNVGFFLGAGTSCALGIPDVGQLTHIVENKIGGDLKEKFKALKKEVNSNLEETEANIEHILNHVRLIRELTNDKADKNYQNVSGETARKIDQKICEKISEVIIESEKEATLSTPSKFFAWLDQFSRDFTKEIFTTNYDLVFEKSLENIITPYFDGFLGANEPFFFYESIDNKDAKEIPPKSWIRIWKMHGSLNWFWKSNGKSNRIIRVNRESVDTEESETVIFPSRKKYDLSRKQPFIAYFDRLKNYLQSGELLFIFSGYSFSDQHINEIIFNSLRQNNRLFTVIFFHKDKEVERFVEIAPTYLNLNVFGPTKCIIKGEIGKIKVPKGRTDINFSDYWNDKEQKFKLGDFHNLVQFLINNSGKSEKQLLNKNEN